MKKNYYYTQRIRTFVGEEFCEHFLIYMNKWKIITPY